MLTHMKTKKKNKNKNSFIQRQGRLPTLSLCLFNYFERTYEKALCLTQAFSRAPMLIPVVN